MPKTLSKFEPDRCRVVAIGSSTGGPNLVQQMICGLPADIPVPILIAQHLPPKFTKDFALSMNHQAALSVVEAQDGMPLFPGTVYIGPGRQHMRVRKSSTGRLSIRISDQPKELLYMPSVDELFESCALAYGPGTLGIVMTGIGQDGVLGAAAIVEQGGVVLTQSRASCPVYGMPKSCDEAGLSSGRLNPEKLRHVIYQLSPSYSEDQTHPPEPSPNPGANRSA